MWEVVGSRISVIARSSKGSGVSALAREYVEGKAAILGGFFGVGKVVLCGPHPETTPGTNSWQKFSEHRKKHRVFRS